MIEQVKESVPVDDAALIYHRFFEGKPVDLERFEPRGSAATIFVRFFDVESQSKLEPAVDTSIVQTTVTEMPLAETTVATVEQPLLKQAQAQEATSLLARLKKGMRKTRSQFTQGLTSLFSRGSFDAAFFDDLEAQLIMADVGVTTTIGIIEKLKEYAKVNDIIDQPGSRQKLQAELKSLLIATLAVQPKAETATKAQGFEMTLIVGVNGVGKTTTIGKLAHQAQAQGKSVMLAAGDTFRAAAVEQLQVWGDRTGVPVVSQGQGSDSASVIYDALQSAQAKNVDVLIADTAGRLHNKTNLMNELHKIVRVVKKLNPDAPHKVLLVVDGCTGQNALSQGKEFNDAVPLTGVVVTKLDGTAKGGILFALSQSLGVPVEYIGIGEQVEDLRPFNAEAYVDALLDFEDKG